MASVTNAYEQDICPPVGSAEESAGNVLLLTAGVLDTGKKRMSGTLDSNVIFLGSPLMGLDFGRR
jgi:hypothetical protein